MFSYDKKMLNFNQLFEIDLNLKALSQEKMMTRYNEFHTDNHLAKARLNIYAPMFNNKKLLHLLQIHPSLLINQLILDYCSLDFLAEKTLNYQSIRDFGFDFCNFSDEEKLAKFLKNLEKASVLTRF